MPQAVFLVAQCDARYLGSIGGMRVYVATKSAPGWAEGAIGLVIGIDPFKVFSKEIEWVRNPNKTKFEPMILRSPNYIRFQDHLIAHQKLLREEIKGPMYNYLFISHLFLDGYSLVNHLNWASYLMDRIASMLESPKILNELLQTNKYEDAKSIHD